MGVNGLAPAGSDARPRALFEELLASDRRPKLCADVAQNTGASAPLVEDAFQDVCLHFLDGKCTGQSMGEVYNWLWIAMKRRVRDKLAHLDREELVASWAETEALATAPALEDEVLEREKARELSVLVSAVVAELDVRRLTVVALHSHGFNRPAIAQEMQTSRKRVKRLLEEAYAASRLALVSQAGGGCRQGEDLVARLSFGLADQRGRLAAQMHISGCDRCATLYRNLEMAHQKIAALTPVPAAIEHDPGLLERVTHKAADALAQAKQQLADTTGLAKQHATASYTRAMEYTPLAGARPGAAATAIAGCLALAGGTATYCVENSVNPIGGVVEIVQPKQTPPKPDKKPEKPPEVAQTHDPPVLPPEATAPPAPPTPEPTPAPQPAAPAPAPAAPAPPPPEPAPPPPAPTPPAVQFGEPTGTPAAASPAPAPAPSAPKPAPAQSGSDLYGP